MDDLKGTVKIVECRIKELQKRLESEKIDRKELGMYDDCGEYYREKVAKTQEAIGELISIKIKLERHRKACNSL